MTLGTAVLISALAIALVLLFNATKDRWKWRRIALWIVLTPLFVASVTAAGVYGYAWWSERPTPQNEFFGIKLGASASDVRFLKGSPAREPDASTFDYHVGTTQGAEDRSRYLVRFKDARVRFVLYASDGSAYGHPSIFSFTIGTRYEEVLKKLGDPTHVSVSSDQLGRTLSFDKYQVFFGFASGAVDALGVYDATKGPVKYASEYKPNTE
jgi:hypothetical protein